MSAILSQKPTFICAVLSDAASLGWVKPSVDRLSLSPANNIDSVQFITGDSSFSCFYGCGLFKSLVRILVGKLGYEIRKKPKESHRGSWWASARPSLPEKALHPDTQGRFRETLSDPVNLLIERDPMAGVVLGGLVKLHTGILVPASGSESYYGRERLSDILTLNRGVHEPLEEFAFQEVVKVIGSSPVMLELGAYWGHYSMWLNKFRPNSDVYLVEPDLAHLRVGIENFRRNELKGTFISAMVAKNHFEVDQFISERGLDRLDILHSDIEGAEVSMLEGCERSFSEAKITYCFIATHSQELHAQVSNKLQSAGFRIEASADFDKETTSWEGFVFAVHKSVPVVLGDFRYLGREQISRASPEVILDTLSGYAKSMTRKPRR